MLNKDCPIPRPFFGFIIPGPAVTKNGLSVVGNTQPQQTFQIQQLNANHHELREGMGTDAQGALGLYCIFCAAAATMFDWQAVLSAEVVPSGS